MSISFLFPSRVSDICIFFSRPRFYGMLRELIYFVEGFFCHLYASRTKNRVGLEGWVLKVSGM